MTVHGVTCLAIDILCFCAKFAEQKCQACIKVHGAEPLHHHKTGVVVPGHTLDADSDGWIFLKVILEDSCLIILAVHIPPTGCILRLYNI